MDSYVCLDTSSSAGSAEETRVEPPSILRHRRAKPATVKPATSNFSLFFWPRRLLAQSVCARRQDKRVTFRASVVVTEYSRAVGPDGVPADGTDLAVGLGKPTWKGLIPLAPKQHGRRSEECGYLPVETRAQMLMESMGHKDFLKVVPRHCHDTAQVKQLREESNEDSKEPPMFMPASYAEARDRALKVAAEVQVAATASDFHPSTAVASWAGDALATPPKEKTCKSQSNAEVEAKFLPPSDLSTSLAIGHDPAEPCQRSAALKRKHPLSLKRINLLSSRKAARMKANLR